MATGHERLWWRLSALVVAVGAGLRLRQYLFGRSLWLDEAMIANNIVRRSFGGLTRPLDYVQGAPLGWLWAERLALDAFGNNELALRLLPLVAGIAGLLVFWHVARVLLPGHLVPVALAFLATAPLLVAYSNEVKQYSTDVLVALVLLAVTLPLMRLHPGWRRIVAWSLCGAALVWFSHPAVLFMSGFSAVVVVVHAARRSWRTLVALLLGCLAWGTGMALNYRFFLRRLTSDPALLDVWKAGFPPRPLRLGTALPWLSGTWTSLVHNPVGFGPPALLGLVALAGATALATSSPARAALLLSPAPVFVAAALAHAYPLRDRLALALVPFLVLLACGAAAIGVRRLLPLAVLALVVLGGLLVAPMGTAVTTAIHPATKEELRPVLAELQQRLRPGDRVWIHHAMAPQMTYYQTRITIPRDAFVRLGHPGAGCATSAALKVAAGHRIWLVFSHQVANPADQAGLYVDAMERWATEVDRISAPGASAHLFDPRLGPAGRPATGDSSAAVCLRVFPYPTAR